MEFFASGMKRMWILTMNLFEVLWPIILVTALLFVPWRRLLGFKSDNVTRNKRLRQGTAKIEMSNKKEQLSRINVAGAVVNIITYLRTLAKDILEATSGTGIWDELVAKKMFSEY